MTVPKKVICPHCGKTVELSKDTKECSNCFGCVGCDQHACPYCTRLIVIEPPKYNRKEKK